MKDEVLFFESQRFRQAWLWLLVISSNATLFYFIFQELSNETGHALARKTAVTLLIPVFICLATTVLLFLIRLETMIKADGIYVRFFPVHRTYRKYGWDKLSNVYVRQYSPLWEYGGWGYRLTIGGGKAYNVSGNKGIQLVANDNSKLLIGTKREGEVSEILKNYFKK